MKFLNTNTYRISILLAMIMLLQVLMPIAEGVAFAQEAVNSITHQVEILDEECEREIEGEINFTLPEIEKKKVDLVIVQDASGSFENTIGTMKEGLKEVVDRLRLGDRAMLVTYKGGRQVQWYTLEDEEQRKYYYQDFGSKWPNLSILTNRELTEDFSSIKAAIDTIEAAGATPTALGLKYALEDYERAKGNSNSNRETIFLFVTDGVANVRLDGRIWIDEAKSRDYYGNLSFHESAQDYETAIGQAVTQAQSIKDKGYYLISTFIEDVDMLSGEDQYGSGYKTGVGPYANSQLKSMATSEEYYIRFDNPDNFGAQVGEKLAQLIDTFVNSQLEIEIEEGYEILEVKLLKDNVDTGIEVDLKNNIMLTLDDLEAGNYTFEYTLKEKDFYPEDKKPVAGNLIIGENEYSIPQTTIEGNTNETCELVPTDPIKKVNDKEHVDLETLQEEVMYTVSTNVPNIYGLTSFVLEDEVDSLLAIIEESVKVVADEENIEGTLAVEGNRITFTKIDNFEEIKGKTVILKFKAKIADDVTYEQVMEKYSDKCIPNKATLKYNNALKDSNTVTITPPGPVDPEEPEPIEPKEPEIEKDVNGKEHEDLEVYEDEFTYNVKVSMPEDVRGYESLIISDTLEDVLNINSSKVLLDGKENEELTGQLNTGDQTVSLSLGEDYDYSLLADRVITLEIKANIKEDADLSAYENDTVPNKATLRLNDNPDVDSNTVTVAPPEPVDPEEPEPIEPEEPEEPEDPEKPEQPKRPILPKTGATTNIVVILMGVALIAIGVGLKKKRA